MEDLKLRELSQDFLIKNVVKHSIRINGEIFHKFKNGRTRYIDLFKSHVKIIDSNGNDLYSNILDIEHPLIRFAHFYYKMNFLKRHAKVGYIEWLSLQREKKFLLLLTEEIYQLV